MLIVFYLRYGRKDCYLIKNSDFALHTIMEDKPRNGDIEYALESEMKSKELNLIQNVSGLSLFCNS